VATPTGSIGAGGEVVCALGRDDAAQATPTAATAATTSTVTTALRLRIGLHRSIARGRRIPLRITHLARTLEAMSWSPRLRPRRRAAGAFALVAAMLVCTASAQAADGWANGKALTSARFMLGAATTPNGTMYVLGGVNGSGDLPTAQTLTIAGTTSTWASLPDMNYYRSAEGVAVGGDGRVYAFGGNGGSTSDPQGDTGNLLNSAEAYDPSAGKWQGVPALPTRRAGMAAVGDTGPEGNGDVYVIGGWDGIGDGYLADNLRYDPSTNSWTTMAPMPTPREFASAVLGSDGDIYVIGGMNDSGPLSTVEVYDPSSNSWTTGPALNTAEYGGSAAAVANRIFVFGGYDGNEAVADTQELIVGGSWSADTAVPRVRYLGAAAVSDALKVYVFGGLGATGTLAATDVFSSVDITPPSGTIQLQSGAANWSSFQVSVLANATDSSGVANVRLSNVSTASGGLLQDGQTQAYVDNIPISWNLESGNGGTPRQGKRYVYVQWEDNAGNWSAIRSAFINIDTIPPTITSGPSPRLLPNTVLNSGTLPVNIYWSGSDAGAIPPTYDLGQTCDGGTTWSTVPLSPATTTQATRALTRGVNCQFRVQARDLAGNTSGPYTMSRVFHGSVEQESAPTITRTGTWTTANSSSYDGGHDSYATKANASMSVKFTGTGIAWVAPTGPTRGSARVYLDGTLQKTISVYSKTPGFRKLMYTHMWAASGMHTLKLVVVGTAGRPRVDVDAFVVLS
jgi:hypothetical protein